MAVIAIDIGGTKIKAALVNTNYQILKSIKVPTRKQKGRAYVLATIDLFIESLLQSKDNITGIGISAPGIFSSEGKYLFAGGALSFLVGTNIKLRLEKKFKLPVVLANDADCFTLAESSLGSFSKAKKILGIIWGSGLGAGAASKSGKHSWKLLDVPLEIGHTFVVHPKTKKLVKRETLVGGMYLLKQYNKLSKEKAATVADIYSSSNKHAKQIMNTAIDELGKVLGNLTTTFQPDIIVLGGGVSQLPKPVYIRLTTLLKKYSLPACSKGVQLKKYSIANDAGLLGAAILASKKR